MDVESTTTEGQDGSGEAAAGPADDATMLKVAREAMEQGEQPDASDEPAEGEPEGVPAPEATDDKPPPEQDADDSPLDKMRKDIAQRAEVQDQREKIRAQIRAEVEQEKTQELAKMRAELAADVRREFREKLKTKPVDTLRESEVDGAALISDLADRASPQGQALDRIAALEQSYQSQLHELTQWKQAQEEREKQAEVARVEAAREASEKTLVDLLSEDKAPHVRVYFGDDAHIVSRAREIAQEYSTKTGEKLCPYSFLVRQLESEAKRGVPERLKALQEQQERLSKLLQPVATQAGQPSESNGRKGPRTLSAQGASERRASPPKAPEEMTEEEAKEAMAAAARGVLGPRKASRMA